MARSKLKIPGIYKLSWPDLNDYFYYGQTVNLSNRYGQHMRALKNGTHDNEILQKIYNKYGVPEFEIVRTCSVSSLDKYEQQLIDTFYDWKHCCNISPSATNKKGWKRSEETRKKISEIRRGKNLSIEHRKSISKGVKCRNANGFKYIGLSGSKNPFFGKKHTEESLNKMRGKSKGQAASNIKAKLVLNLETGIYYNYAGEAAMAIGMNPQYLRRMLNGDRANKTSFIYA